MVFIGPYEHHSNELVWRESVADVVTIGESADGRIDVGHLERELRRHADRALRIGSFSAASNVTGIITDVDRVSRALRRHGALSCWDYATAGPYLPIDMSAKDAVFLSPHKFVGGPGHTRCARRQARPTAQPSPGACRAVARSYSSPRTVTPTTPIRCYARRVGRRRSSSRSGPASCSRSSSGSAPPRSAAASTTSRAGRSRRGARNPNIEILGNTSTERLPIVSLGLRHPPRLLHSNFVVAVLSDLFGIQARSGCFCAGPYLHRLYRVDDEWSARMSAECERGHLGVKLGFVRLGFNYFISEDVFQYVLEAVHLLADHAWKLLPLYRFDPDSGLWHHRDRRPAPTLGDARIPRVTGRSGPHPRPASRGGEADRPRRRGGAAGRVPTRPATLPRVRADPLVPAAR